MAFESRKQLGFAIAEKEWVISSKHFMLTCQWSASIRLVLWLNLSCLY